MKTIGKKLKAIYLMAVIALVSICMSFIPLMANTVKADVTPSATNGLRIMGAQVKVIDGVQGEHNQFAVYFHTEITEEFYNNIKTDENKVQFGVLIGPKVMLNTYEDYTATPVEDFDADVGQVVTTGNLTNTSKAANFRFVGDELAEAVEFVNGVKTFEAGIVFDEDYLLSSGVSNILELATATKLAAIPYYVVDGNATMNTLDIVSRAAKDVLIETKVRIANNSSSSNLDEETIDHLLNKYVGEVEYIENEFYFDKTINKVYAPNINNELVLLDTSEISATFACCPSGEFDGKNLKEGSTFGVSYLENGVTKIASAKVVTRVLSNIKDFFNDADGSGAVEDAEMTRANYIFNLMPLSATGAANPRIAIKGYYVLANNIDLKSNGNLCNRSMKADGTNGSGDHTVQIFDGSKDVGFRGTLDGRGFALMNLNPYGSSAGMFGAFYGATVKNIAFYSATNSASNGSGLVIGYVYNSTFENVYIRLVGNTGGDGYSGADNSWRALVVSNSHGGSTIKNLIVESFDGLAAGKTNHHQRFTFGNNPGAYENAAIVGMPATFSAAAATADSSKYTLSITISAEAIANFDAEAGVEYALESCPKAATAYTNLIANLESRRSIDIAYIKFVADVEGRAYYLDNASLAASESADVYAETGCWVKLGDELIWKSLVDETMLTVDCSAENGEFSDSVSLDMYYAGAKLDAEITVSGEGADLVIVEGNTITRKANAQVFSDKKINAIISYKGIKRSVELTLLFDIDKVITYESGEFIVDKATGKVLKADANNQLRPYNATNFIAGQTKVFVNGITQNVLDTAVFTLDKATLSTLVDGEKYIISAGDNCLVAQVVTKVFFSINDFFADANGDGAITDDEKTQANNFFNVATAGTADKKVTGYYVLANNIDATGAPLKANNSSAVISNTSADFGFQATLDGRGFALSNLNIFNGTGLFGLIKNATIKDIAICNLSNSRDDSNRPLIANAIMNSTLENVYFTVAEYWIGWNQKYRTTSNAIGSISNSTLTNVIFENNAWKSNTATIQRSENSWYGFGTASTNSTYTNTYSIGAPITVGYKVEVAATDTETAKYKLIFTLPLATIQKYVAAPGVYALADCGGAETDFAKLIAGIKAGETGGTASLANMDIQYIEFVAETSTRGYYYDRTAILENTQATNALLETGMWKVKDGALVWSALAGLQHTYSQVTKEPTCTEQGYTMYLCDCGCGDNYVENYVPALGHEYGAWVSNGDGTHTRVCATDSSHVVTEECNGGTPTCTEKAICKDCGTEYGAPNGHAYQVVVTAPTCTTQGYTTYTCHCGDTYIDNYVDALGHNHQPLVTAPTCTEQGYTTYTCHCGDTYVDNYVDALGHTEVIDNAVAPTCMTTGLTQGKHCSVCKETLVAQQVVDALGHDYGAWISNGNDTHTKVCANDNSHVITEDCNGGTATCIDKAICKDCGTEYGEPNGHDYQAVVTAPTCTEQGYTTYTCHCGDTYVDNYVEGGGHQYEEVITFPTCTEQGYTTYTCHCGDTYVGNYVDALGHTYKLVVTAPTCTEQGYTTYTCHCGDTYVDNYVDALGHNYIEYRNNGNDTHTKICANDKMHVIVEDCFGGEATCLSGPICEGCNFEYGDAGDHSFDSSETCTICGQTLSGFNFEISSDGTCVEVVRYNGKAKDVTIPTTYRNLPVTIIRANAFYLCSTLRSVEIPYTIKSIGEYAFALCSSLESVKIAYGLTSIGDYAFTYSTALTEIVIPSSVTEMGSKVFADCSALTTIYCKTASQPSTWVSDWKDGCDATVVWEYSDIFESGEFVIDKTTGKVYKANVNNELVSYDATAFLSNSTSVFVGGTIQNVANVTALTFETTGLETLTFGKEYEIVAGDNVLKAKVVTRVLSNVKDFFVDANGDGVVADDEMTKANYIFNLKTNDSEGAKLPSIAVKGYYVLANNIDLQNNGNLVADDNGSSSYTVQIWNGSADVGFRATLDGRGFALKNGKVYTSGGMFGAFYAATIKNIAFDGFTHGLNHSGFNILGYVYRSTFENVYIRLTGTNDGDGWLSEGGKSAIAISDSHGGSTFTNVVCESMSGLVAGNTSKHQRPHFTGSTLGTFNNSAIVGMPVTYKYATSTTDASKMVLTLTLPADVIASFDAQASVEIALDACPKAATAYANLIANLENKYSTDIAYISFVADIAGREYYLDNAGLANSELASVYAETGNWVKLGGDLVWKSLVDASKITLKTNISDAKFTDAILIDMFYDGQLISDANISVSEKDAELVEINGNLITKKEGVVIPNTRVITVTLTYDVFVKTIDVTIVNIDNVQLYESGEFFIDKTTGKIFKANDKNELIPYDATGYLAEETEIFVGTFKQTLVNATEFTLDATGLASCIEDKDYVITAGNNVLVAKVVTKVLSNLKDFFVDANGDGVVADDEMIQSNYIFDLKVVASTGARTPKVAIKGYYVLANNIDLKGSNALVASGLGDQTVQIWSSSTDVGFRATLDGRGFALKNGNPGGSSGGMFGAFNSATIKNIAFDGFTNTRNDSSVLLLGFAYRSTFENVYIRAVGNAYGDTYLSSNAGLSAIAVSNVHGGSRFANVVFESMDGLIAGRKNDHYRITFSNQGLGTFENTTIIGMPVSFALKKHATDTAKYVLNITLPEETLIGYGVKAGEYELSALPKAVTNAYGELIANIEAPKPTSTSGVNEVYDIEYVNFIEDIKGRSYYYDNAEFSKDVTAVNKALETGLWKVYAGKLIWASLLGGEHSYNAVVTEPTCTEDGYTMYICTCGCGDTYKTDIVKAKGHEFIEYKDNGDGTHTRICANDNSHVETLVHQYKIVVVNPTCTAQGYTKHVCDCGNTYIDNYVDAIGHSYGGWISNGDNTHSKVCENDSTHEIVMECNGGTPTCTEKAICIVCGGEYGEILEHEFDDDGSCLLCGQDIATTKGFLYKLSEDEKSVQVIQYVGDSSIVIVPNYYNNLPVTSIGEGAFYGCDTLTSVIIGNNVTSIGYGAFSYCYSLESVTLGKGVTSIAYGAFGHCEALKSIVIGENVNYIGHYAFAFCSSLESVTLPNSLTEIGDGVFANCSSIESIKLPDNLTAISYGLFKDCTSLTNITVSEKTTQVADKAFLNCPIENAIVPVSALESLPKANLKSLVIVGKGEIADSSFYGCDTLESVTIGKGVTHVGKNAFNCCSKLESITVDALNQKYHTNGNCLIETDTNTLILGLANSVIPNNVTSIGENAFYDCDSLLNVTIPNSVVTIQDNAFYGCDSLVRVTMGNSVRSIGKNAFYGCSSLLTMSISNDIEYIGNGALDNCDSLQYNLSNGLKYLGNNTNKYLVLVGTTSKSITSVEINVGCKVIYEYAFDSCTSLTSVNIPNSVVYIGKLAFNNCPIQQANIPAVAVAFMPKSTLRTLTINGGEEISSYALSDFSVLTDVTIMDGVTSIGEGAFYGCTALTNVSIPNSVTSIGTRAFDNCDDLQYYLSNDIKYLGNSSNRYLVLIGVANKNIASAQINSNCKFISDYAFKDCDSITSVTISNNVVSIGKGAFYGCDSLTDVTIGDNVTEIGTSAFANCPIESATVGTMAMSHIPTNSLQTLVITSGESIPAFAFYGCSNLTSVTLSNSVTSIGKDAFAYTSLTNISIGNNIESVGNRAFDGLYNLQYNVYNGLNYLGNSTNKYLVLMGATDTAVTSVSINENCKVIYDYALANCTKLASINIPNSVISIGDYAFSYCNSLTSITIPASVTNIGKSIVFGCDNLASIEVNAGNTKYHSDNNALIETKTNTLLVGCNDTVIPDYVTAIGNAAFYNRKTLTSIIIPSGASIGNYAFYGCTALESVIIPNGVTSIGNYAFYGCTALTSITGFDGITSIGDYTFYGCTSLSSITIPKSVSSIGNYAFADCTALTTIKLPNALMHVGEYAFSGCMAQVDWGNAPAIKEIGINAFNGYKGTSLEIPDGVTYIGKNAFANCTELKQLIIPASVTTVKDDIIADSYSITIVYCEAKVQPNDWSNSWKGNRSITVVWGYDGFDCDLPNHEHNIIKKSSTAHWYECECGNKTIKEAHTGGVATCTELAICSVCGAEYGDYATHTYSAEYSSNKTYHWKQATCGCDLIQNYEEHTLDENGWCLICGKPINPTASATYEISADGTYAQVVGYQGNLLDLVIADTFEGLPVTTIIDGAFEYCSTITSVVIPDSVRYIGDNAFYGCYSLESVVIGNGVTNIGKGAFEGCSSLKSIVIPFVGNTKDGTTNTAFGYIFGSSTGNDNASYVPTSLKSVVVTGGTKINDYAFYGCSSIEMIKLPNSITAIGTQAFYNCSSLKSIIIPDSVTSVGTQAFANCSALNSVTIGKGVVTLGSQAFEGCTNITKVNYTGTIDQWAMISFSWGGNPTYHAKDLYIGDELVTKVLLTTATKISSYAFYNCASIEVMFIPADITVGSLIIYNNTSLETIYIEEESQPSDWMTDWKEGFNGTIVWGHVHTSDQITCIKKATCLECGIEYGKASGHEFNILKYNSTEHWYECECGIERGRELHHGGEASSTELSICIVCGQEHGNYDNSGVSEQINIVNGIYHEVYIEEGIISTNDKVNAQLDANDRGLVVGLADEAMEILLTAEKIYDGSNLVTFVDGRIVGLSGKTLGSEGNILRIIREEQEYTLEYMYVTRAIRNVKDLSYKRDAEPFIAWDITAEINGTYIFGMDIATLSTEQGALRIPTFQIDGYYVLANNIFVGSSIMTDVGQLEEDKIYSGHEGYIATSRTDVGFTGTFDGRGHSIEDITTYKGGLFGYINGGTIKNTAFIDMANGYEGQAKNVFADYSINAHFENIYVNLKEQSKDNGDDAWSNFFSNGTVHVKNSILESFVLDTKSQIDTNYIQFLNGETGSTYENVHTIGSSPLEIVEIYNDGGYRILKLAVTQSELAELGYSYGDVISVSNDATAWTKLHGITQATGVELVEVVPARDGVAKYDSIDKFNSAMKNNSTIVQVFMNTGSWKYNDKTGALEWKDRYYEKDNINPNLNIVNGIYREVYIEEGITASDKGLVVGLSDDAREILTRANAIYDGSKLVTFVDGKIVGLTDKTLGSEGNVLRIIRGENEYTLEYMYVTRAIRHVNDFSINRNAFPTTVWYNIAEKHSTYIFEMPMVSTSVKIPTLKIEGYYVLANDIDVGGLSYDHPGQKMGNVLRAGHAELRYPSGSYSTDVGFQGTFDGRGHTMENFTSWQGGMFGYINGGTLKNIAFVNACNYWQQANKNLFADLAKDAYFENIYVQMRAQDCDQGSGSYYEYWANLFARGTIHAKNCVLESFILDGYAQNNTNYVQFLNMDSGSTYENVHCVGTSPLAIISWDYNQGVKLAITEKEMQAFEGKEYGIGFNYEEDAEAYLKYHSVMTAINNIVNSNKSAYADKLDQFEELLRQSKNVVLVKLEKTGVDKYDSIDEFKAGIKANATAKQAFMDTGCWTYNEMTGLLEWKNK